MKKQGQSLEEELKPYLKLERTVKIEYEIVKKMLNNIDDEQGIINSEAYSTLFNALSPKIKELGIFEILSYKLWLNDSFPASVR